MNAPDSFIDLLAMQPLDVRLNALLESYLIHHADSAIKPIAVLVYPFLSRLNYSTLSSQASFNPICNDKNSGSMGITWGCDLADDSSHPFPCQGR